MVGVESMAMGSGRSKPPLHNFTLPCGLKWGNQKFLRCAKLDSNGEIGSGLQRRGSDERVREMGGGVKKGQQGESGRKFRADVEDGIAAVRKKLMYDLQEETDKMKDAILRTGLKGEADEERRRRRPVVEAAEERSPPPTTIPKTITQAPAVASPETATDSAKRWNLRTRRSGSKQPNGFAAGSGESNPSLKVDVSIPNASPVRTENKSPRLRNCAATAGAFSGGEKRDREKFSVPLSRREIEEDFTTIVNHRPPRRPKKRAKHVQRTLDTVFPGLWLTEITPDMYKVSEDQ